MKNKSILYRFGFYPLLLGLYPVLYLWLANYYKVKAFVVPSTILITEAAAAAVYLLAWLVMRRNGRKAAALSSLGLALFFFYGHVYNLLDIGMLFGIDLGKHSLLLPLWLVLFAGGAFWILRSRSDFQNFTWVANLVGIFLVTINLLQIGYEAVRTPGPAVPQPAAVSQTTAQPGSTTASSAGPGRDIYYILLDAYARQDYLQTKFNYDNRGFLKQLKDMGFVVPDCNQSNYEGTSMSMSSTLNMDYLDSLGYPYDELARSDHDKVLNPLLADNLVFKKMRQYGYQIVTFASLYPPIDFQKQSDIFYNLEAKTAIADRLDTLLFQNMLLKTTLLKTVTDYQMFHEEEFEKLPPFLASIFDPSSKLDTRNYKQYLQNLYALEKLEGIPQLPGRKFVYAHLFLTHQPFTFNADGSFRLTFRDSNAAYRDQVINLNTRLIPILKTILSQSTPAPIIVIQGDHTFTFTPEEKFKNLSAFYLPDGGSEKVYPQITNLNTFRLIFSYYFHEDYPFLPDVSIMLNKDLPGGYTVIPGSCVHEGQTPRSG